MDTLRPLDGSGPSKPGVRAEAGSAPVARVEALTPVEGQGEVSEQAAATVAQSLQENREVLQIADKSAVAIDHDAVAELKQDVSEGRYVLSAEVLADRLMEDAGLLLPVTVSEE